jgi:ankyrin repeat protein
MPEQHADLSAIVARGDVTALSEALEAGADADARDRWGAPVISHAAARGGLEAVRVLLKHGADPELKSAAGNTALMIAAACGHGEIARVLLDAGADPNVKNKWDVRAMDWAQWAKDPNQMRALLVNAGADE